MLAAGGKHAAHRSWGFGFPHNPKRQPDAELEAKWGRRACSVRPGWVVELRRGGGGGHCAVWGLGVCWPVARGPWPVARGPWPVARACGRAGRGTCFQVCAGHRVARTVSVAVRAVRRLGARGHGHMADGVVAATLAWWFLRRSGAICRCRQERSVKTVGSAYVGSNPTPATHFRRSKPVTLDCVTGFTCKGSGYADRRCAPWAIRGPDPAIRSRRTLPIQIPSDLRKRSSEEASSWAWPGMPGLMVVGNAGASRVIHGHMASGVAASDHQPPGAADLQKPLNRAFRPGTSVAVNCRDDVHLVEPTVLKWLLSRPGAGFPPPNARGYAVSRSSKESGVMSMWNSRPSTLASRDKVARDGS